MGEKEDKGFTKVIEIADEVIQVIAGIAASGTEGVAAMSGGIADGIAKRLGRKNLSRGVKAAVGEEGAKIDVYIIAKYGTDLTQLFKEVQKNVKNAVEGMTGITVVEVNVSTQGLSFENEENLNEDNVEEANEEQEQEQKQEN
ncbi:MAG TPA: Asp23/Gls24 family envelope stress response protein [Peptococcaceae bacterium]|nr:Asp23/Gls24 family envelope stress response protein [Peptococcaceae bacterium]